MLHELESFLKPNIWTRYQIDLKIIAKCTDKTWTGSEPLAFVLLFFVYLFVLGLSKLACFNALTC